MERKIDIYEYNKSFLQETESPVELLELLRSLDKGIAFERKGTGFVLKRVSSADHVLIEEIVTAVNGYEQLVPVTDEDIKEVADSGLGLCITTEDGGFASYLGAEVPEFSSEMNTKYSYLEIRTSITVPEHTKKGLNSTLKTAQIMNVLALTHRMPLAFTDEIPGVGSLPKIESGAIGINKKLNLIEISVGDLPKDFQEHMVGPCPVGRCVYKHGAHPEQEACACNIWLPDVNHQPPETGIEVLDNAVQKYWEVMMNE